MGKTPKLKKKDISVHSRAARRGEEPPAKDLASLKPPVSESDYKPWLHSAQGAGIQKKQKKKQLTRAQKVRQQKIMEKADETAARLEKKVKDSKRRARAVQARRKDWEDLNGSVKAMQESDGKGGFGVLGDGEDDWESEAEGGDRDGDEDMGTAEVLPIRAVADGAATGLEPEGNRPPPRVLTAEEPVPEPAWASMHATKADFLGGEVT